MDFFKTPETIPAYKQQGWSSSQIGDIPYLGLTLAFSMFVFVLEMYLDVRQLKKLMTAKKIPKELESCISEETFHKSTAYGTDKFQFGLIESSIMFMEGLGLIFLGYLPFLWDNAEKAAGNLGLFNESNSALYKEIIITVVFVFFITLHDTLISLPFSLFRTFVVEQKHGFNKSTLGLFFRDTLVSLGLTMALGYPVISMVVGLIRWGGPYFYFYVWIFLFIVSIVAMTIYPTLIAPLFNKYTQLEAGPLYESIEALAKKVKFPLAKIFLVDGSKRSAHSNAYFYGFFKNKRIVLFDTLIEQVETPELLAILGHEIGHWKLMHTMQGFVITQVYIFCLFLAFSFVQYTPGLFAAFGFRFQDASAVPVFVGLVLFSQTFWSPVDKVLSLIMNFNSRANEFAADRFAKDLGMGEDLGKGLIKISIENLGNMVPDELYSLYHFSHPPLVERLRALNVDLKDFKFKPVVKKADDAAATTEDKKSK